MPLIELNYGDPSHDGHSMSATDYYESSHPTSAIKAAMCKAEQTLNFSWKNVCSSYGTSSLTDEQYNLFKSAIDVDTYLDLVDGLYVHDFTGLYLAIAKTQLPDLVTEFNPITTDTLDIGGYGLFEN